MTKVLTAIIIGAGGRGTTYASTMAEMKDKFRVVGVAEPIKERRDNIQKMFDLPDSVCFSDWSEILELPKMADIAVIATMDRLHFAPAMCAIEKKYNLLLEKPAAPTPEECVVIKDAAKTNGVKVLVCHVLRYTSFYSKLKKLIDDGAVGRVMSVHAEENVGNLHQSHSFVRGNWGNSIKSSSMILQKTCHDMDIFQWLIGEKCKNVSSFGSLTYFTKDNAPKDAPEYCIEGCPHADTCYYNAVKLYYDDKENSWFRGAATRKSHPTDEDVLEALKTTQYGKCVYKCDNNVVDHQVVNLEFEGGAVVSFNMCAFNKGGRFIKVMGTDGMLTNKGDNELELYSFATKECTTISTSEDFSADANIANGHGGGDAGIIHALYDYMANDICDSRLSEIDISVSNHMISFAAEEARRTNSVVNIESFEKNVLNN